MFSHTSLSFFIAFSIGPWLCLFARTQARAFGRFVRRYARTHKYIYTREDIVRKTRVMRIRSHMNICGKVEPGKFYYVQIVFNVRGSVLYFYLFLILSI